MTTVQIQKTATISIFLGTACRNRPEPFDWHPASDPQHDAHLELALRTCATCPALGMCRAWLASLEPSERPLGVTAGTLRSPTKHQYIPTGRPRGRPLKPIATQASR